MGTEAVDVVEFRFAPAPSSRVELKQVGDVGDVDTSGKDEVEGGLAEHGHGGADRDRPQAGDLAEFVAFDVAAPQGFGVEADEGVVEVGGP